MILMITTIQGWFNHKSDMNERYIITKGRDIPPASSHRFWGLRSNNDGSLFFDNNAKFRI